MNFHLLGAIFSFVCLAAAIIVMNRVRQMKLVYITDFQAGVKFTDATMSKILPSGVFRSNDGGSSIMVVDMRPHHFIIERIGYQNAMHANSIISVGGDIVVRNPQRVVSKMKNLLQESLPMIREGICVAGSRLLLDASLEGRIGFAATITTELNTLLEAYGVEARNLEITELWSNPVDSNNNKAAN